MHKMRLLVLLLLWASTLTGMARQRWHDVAIPASVTHVQPMTGLVLWPQQAKALHAQYGQAIQLEFAYCLPCRVVTGCQADGTLLYDWTWLERLMDDVASRGHQLIVRFRYEYPSSRDVDGQVKGKTAVPDYIRRQADYHETYNDVPGDGPTYYADWSNAELQRFTLQFYTDFAQRYAHDPRLAFLEVGFGHWSEYHIYGTPLELGRNFPSKDFQRQFFLHMEQVMGDIPWAASIDCGEERYSPIPTDEALNALHFGLFDDSFMHEGHEVGTHGGYNERLWRLTDRGHRWQYGVCGGEISYYKRTDQTDFLNPQGMHGHTWEEQSSKYHLSFMIANDAPRGTYGTAQRFRQAGMAIGYHLRVTSCQTDGRQTRLTVTNTGCAPLYRDAYFAIGDQRSPHTLRGLLPGESRTIQIPAPLPADRHGNARVTPTIVSDHILPTQRIEYEFLMPPS